MVAKHPEWLTVEEIAAELRVSERTVRNYIANGDLPAVKLERAYRVRRRDYEEWLRRRTV